MKFISKRHLALASVFFVGSVALFFFTNALQPHEISYNASIAKPLSSFYNPATGDTEVPAGAVAFVDANLDTGKLTITGELHCENSPSAEIKAKTIYVNGVFQCGRRDAPYSKKLIISLKAPADASFALAKANSSFRALLVNQGGKLTLNGRTGKAAMARLSVSAVKDATSITLDRSVAGVWEVGDEIAIAPTSYKWDERESFKILSIDSVNPKIVYIGTTGRLDSGDKIKFFHWGAAGPEVFQTRAGLPNTLDERAEVVNLSRNIVIRAYEPPDAPISDAQIQEAELGGHVMVMRGGQAYVDAVEFSRMGQAGLMGRYPFHWHLAGDVPGQYIKNSSVHHSFQRCITVHQTNYTLVTGNTCYEFKGHGYFFETGNEVENTMSNNIGIAAKAPYRVIKPAGTNPGNSVTKVLLASDNTDSSVSGVVPDRFPAVSVFWISNPRNSITGNIAAGSVGTGFWNSFNQASVREYNSATNQFDGAILLEQPPAATNTKAYENNIAHSTWVGHNWDGAPVTYIGNVVPLINNPNNPMDRRIESSHYHSGDAVPVIRGMVAYKNKNAGMYFRGKTTVFEKSIMAENGWSFFMAYNQVIKNSTVISRTQNFSTADDEFLYLQNNFFKKQAGIVMYDGPFELENVDFINFTTVPVVRTRNVTTRDVTPAPIMTIGGARKFVNQSKSLRFSPEPYFRALDNMTEETSVGTGWLDVESGNMIRDLDGSLTGVANSIIVPNDAFIADANCALPSRPETLKGFKVCNPPYRSVQLFLAGLDTNKIPFVMARNHIYSLADVSKLNGVATIPNAFINKVGLITSTKYSYDLIFRKKDVDSGVLKDIRVHVSSEQGSQSTPVIRTIGLGSNCSVVGGIAKTSVAAVESATDVVSYYSNGNDLYFKMIAAYPNGLVHGTWTGVAHPNLSSEHVITCSGKVINKVIGALDSVTKSGTDVIVSGWACDYGQDLNIDTHLYVGGAAGAGGVMIANSMANLTSENAVRTACGVAENNYRFRYVIPQAQWAGHEGKRIYVHGISKSNLQNLVIDPSKDFRIPASTNPVNGSCGNSNNVCNAGTLSDTPDSATHYLWTCQGLNGGALASCSVAKPPVTVVACAAATKSWVVSGRSCTGNVAARDNGQTATALDSMGMTRGSAQFTCNNGVWSAPVNAYCEPYDSGMDYR